MFAYLLLQSPTWVCHDKSQP